MNTLDRITAIAVRLAVISVCLAALIFAAYITMRPKVETLDALSYMEQRKK
jgi:hypothetical protein